MEVIKSYYIKRGNTYIWLAQGIKPKKTDEIIEKRPMLVASDGKTLSKDGEVLCEVIWLKDGDVPENYEEREIQPEPEPEPEDENG